MRALYTLFAFLAVAFCLTAQTPVSAVLETNRVKSTFNSDGTLFSDFQTGQFIAPYTAGQPEISLLRAAGIWLAGTDPAGNLMGAANLYRSGGLTDFVPGGTSGALNKIWRVTEADIVGHLADLADNGIIDQPNPNIFSWPARGNPFFQAYNPGLTQPLTLQGQAGFFDADGDALYDPSAGDYPSLDIRGCPFNRTPTEMLWFVYSDETVHTQSGLNPMSTEIQCQVFAFDCVEDDPLRNAVFVRYKLINRATEPLYDVHVGLFNDFDIGNPGDDFVGSDPTRSLIFGYNGDNIDEAGFGTDIPVLGVKMLRGPLDLVGNEIPLSHAVNFDPASLTSLWHYYRLLQGLNIDGTPAPNNGQLYPGNPNDPGSHSEVSAGNTPGNRCTVASFGPFTLLPGAVNELIAGYFFTQVAGNSPLQNVQAMYAQADALQADFDNCFTNMSCTSPLVDAPELPGEPDLKVYPSPATMSVSVESTGGTIQGAHIFDQTGRLVLSRAWSGQDNIVSFPVNTLPTGIYAVSLQLSNGQIHWKKLSVAR